MTQSLSNLHNQPLKINKINTKKKKENKKHRTISTAINKPFDPLHPPES